MIVFNIDIITPNIIHLFVSVPERRNTVLVLISSLGREAKTTIHPHIWSRLITPKHHLSTRGHSDDILFAVQIALHICLVINCTTFLFENAETRNEDVTMGWNNIVIRFC